jgi:hypothetical protein
MVVNDSVYGSLNRSRALKLLDEIRVKEEASTEKTFRSLDYIDSKI